MSLRSFHDQVYVEYYGAGEHAYRNGDPFDPTEEQGWKDGWKHAESLAQANNDGQNSDG